MSLKMRLSILTLIVSVPLLIAITYLITHIAAAQMREDADERLRLLNLKLADTAQMWLDFHTRTLTAVAAHPDVMSMNPARQKPQLDRVARIYNHIYLVATTDLQGRTVARSNGSTSVDYHDRQWFKDARSGWTAYQSLVGRTGNQPAMVVAMPIRNDDGNIVGVCMFAGFLTELSREVRSMRIGNTGFAYLVDTQNRVIAHPDTVYTAELRDFSNNPAVVALRRGHRGPLAYTDGDGVAWEAYVSTLDNGWGSIVQQQQSEILAPLESFRKVSRGIVAAGAVALLILSAALIRRALQPVSHLTETTTAIASGDLSRRARITHNDEIGILSQAFNRMVRKLQNIIHRQQQQAKHLEATNTLLQSEVDARKLIESRLRDLAEIDPLTGIPNRRKLLIVLDREMKRSERFKQPLSLIMFDIDRFKEVNDRFGHDAGDATLKATTTIADDAVRETDLVARYGGEEFIVVCTGTQLHGARVLAEKILKAIEAHEFARAGRVTISLGIAEFRSIDSIEAFIKRADDALYKAKSSGHNRTELESPQ